jgi:LemA protein
MMFGAAMFFGLVLAGAILLGLLWAVASFNGLAAARAEYGEAFSHVLLRLRQRIDLLPTVADTARSHMRHERETLDGLDAAVREAATTLQALEAQPVGASEMRKLREVESGMNEALARFMALSSVYPELRASPSMVRLAGELSQAENQISAAKQAYDLYVARYNGLRSTVSQSVLAGFLGFGDVPLFATNEEPAPPPSQPQRLGTLKA